MAGVIKGKFGKLGRAKPPVHPMGTPFQNSQTAQDHEVLHGVPGAGSREQKAKGTGVPSIGGGK